MNTIPHLRHRVRAYNDPTARALLSEYGKRGARQRAHNRLLRAYAMILLHEKATYDQPDEAVMNEEGDIVPRYSL